ncbi:MAG: hypothetical protein K0R99_429 [Microbacterium sp.]|nr:hypothetical protein [Microbacterium sp.]
MTPPSRRHLTCSLTLHPESHRWQTLAGPPYRQSPEGIVAVMDHETATARSGSSSAEIRVVFDRHLDVVATTPLAMALTAAFTVGNNLARSFFLNPEAAETLGRWGEIAGQVAGLLRVNLAEFGQDPRFEHLIGELGAHSQEFREQWARTDLEECPATQPIDVFHPMTGRQQYEASLSSDGGDGRVLRWVPADAAAEAALSDLWSRTRPAPAQRLDSAR